MEKLPEKAIEVSKLDVGGGLDRWVDARHVQHIESPIVPAMHLHITRQRQYLAPQLLFGVHVHVDSTNRTPKFEVLAQPIYLTHKIPLSFLS